MDLETENRIAAILLKEAAEIRRQAQQDGALAYLRNPTVRGRPNSRFLTATVRGIQQVNRALEVNEMWRVRQKEKELDDKLRDRRRDHSHSSRDGKGDLSERQSKRHSSDSSCSSSKRSYEEHSKDDEGLKDEEIEEFLHSRVKRGRGSIGSRVDETGPFLPRSSESSDSVAVATDYRKDERRHKAVLGPKKPLSWKRCESSDDDEQKRSRKNTSSGGSEKKHSKKHKSKEKRRDKKRKKDKRHKH